MRLSQCLIVSRLGSSIVYRLTSIVSRPRARPHLAGGGCVRGTSHIAIGEMARIWREITVRNVVFGGITARRDASPHRAAPAAAVAGRPPYHSAAASAASPAVGRATMTGGFLSHGGGIFEPRWESDLPTIRERPAYD